MDSLSRWLLATTLLVAMTGALVAQRPRTLVINGKDAGPVMQMRGRNYVDVETLAQNTNASVKFEADRIVLTTAPGQGSETEKVKVGLSKQFAGAGLAELAQGREWKAAVETMIMYQVPVTGSGTYFQDYHNRSEEALQLAKVAASTTEDFSAYQLLENGFHMLANWADSAVATREALNATRTTSPDVLRNDSELQRINTCGRFLNSMLSSGSFSDDSSCH